MLSKLILFSKIWIVRLIRFVGRQVKNRPQLRRQIVSVVSLSPYISRRLRRIISHGGALKLNAPNQIAEWQMTPRARALRQKYDELKK